MRQPVAGEDRRVSDGRKGDARYRVTRADVATNRPCLSFHIAAWCPGISQNVLGVSRSSALRQVSR